MNVFISAGEASGDVYGSRLAQALLEQHPQAVITAIGGPMLSKVANIVADSSGWGAIGIVQSLKILKTVKTGKDAGVAHLQSTPPGLFIPIDFGYVNAILAKTAKEAGWKVLYFIPPSSWRRELKNADLANWVDAIVTPFPWNAEAWQRAGVEAHFLGHPIRQLIEETQPDHQAEGTIALLPGSRKHELTSNLPVMKHVVQDTALPATICPAPTVSQTDIVSIWGSGALPRQSETRPTLKAAKAAIVCSGSATLEAALANCPSVVVYRGSLLTEFEYRIRRPNIAFISLPNIFLQRSAVPELIQDEATPENILRHLEPLLDPSSKQRQAQMDAYQEIAVILPSKDVFKETVDLVQTLDLPN